MKKFQMRLVGNLNGVGFALAGKGQRSAEEGLVEGQYELTRNDGEVQDIPGLDHWIFNCLVITGYPSETFANRFNRNPFKERPYHYHRKIDFFERGVINLETSVAFSSDGLLDSQFVAKGDVNVPRLVSVEPTVETWVPLAEYVVLGSFTMSWIAENGKRIAAIATTRYDLLGEGPSLLATQHRWIEINATGNLWKFTRHQRSRLIDEHCLKSAAQ